MSAQTTTAPDRFPPQAKYIVGNEAAERFSYYGVKGILALYITGALWQTKDYSTNVIHLFSFVNYFMPLLGAWVSDRYWGRYHTILWISLSYCVGHGVMALSDAIPTVEGKLGCLWIGLGLIAFGSGGIKPCVSAFMGDQFKPEQSKLLPKAYAAFYLAINVGSTLAFFVVPWCHKNYGYSWAFGVPGIAMALATFVFWLGTPRYTRVPPSAQTKSAGFFRVLFHALARRHARQPGEKFWDAARDRFTHAEVDAASSIGPILSIFALIPVFWALYDQTFSTWILQGEQMKSWFPFARTEFAAADIKNVDNLTKAFLFGTNAASTQVTTTNAIVGTNRAALFVWNQFPPASQQLIRDANQPSASRAQAITAEFNKLVAGSSLYDTNRFAGLELETDARLMLKKELNPSSLRRLNRLLLEEVFSRDVAKVYRIGPEEMLSVNSIGIMIFIPILSWGIYPLLGRWARPLRRIGVGLFLMASSFVVVAWLQTRVDAGDEVSILWQTAPYVILTLAEVLVSATGLEFAFTQAAPTMKSTIMALWYVAIAFGNLLVIVITSALGGGHGEGSVTPQRFMLYAGMMFVAAILFSFIAARYRYRDQPVAAV